MPRKKADAAAVVFALLVVATVVAFAYAQRVKRDPLLIDRVEIGKKNSNSFTPKGRCERHIRLKFRTTTSNEATVEIIRPGGELVRDLAKHTFLKRYSYHVFHWDGKNRAGVVQPPGRYRIRVMLEGEGRELTLPGTIRLQRRGSC
jgi:flagellar hook assembly protein FlgD